MAIIVWVHAITEWMGQNFVLDYSSFLVAWPWTELTQYNMIILKKTSLAEKVHLPKCIMLLFSLLGMLKEIVHPKPKIL